MTHIVTDMVKETTITSGTGNYALGGAMAGYRSFGQVMANGDTTYYCCVGADNAGLPAFEVGYGTYNSGSGTLARTQIKSNSSNTTAAINWGADSVKAISMVASAFAQLFLDVNGVLTIPKTVSGQSAPAAINSGSAKDLTYANVVRVTLTANTTLGLPNMASGSDEAAMIVELVQDGTGGRTVTWEPGSGKSIKWDSSASAPAINTTAGKETHIAFRKRADGTVYYGQVVWYEA